TDAVLDEVATWQSRPLEPVYPLVFFDALRVKIRDEGHVRNKAIYGAIDDKAAEAALTTFEGGFWGRKFPVVAQIWRRAWQEVIP
ncbi:transposase, partial [Rhizobium laguerreae]